MNKNIAPPNKHEFIKDHESAVASEEKIIPRQGSVSAFDLPWKFFEMSLGFWPGLMKAASKATPDPVDFPKSEILETPASHCFMVGLPSIHRDQITLRIEHKSIMLRVSRSNDPAARQAHPRYNRTIKMALPLPIYINGKSIKAELKEGVLSITIPKNDTPIAPDRTAITVQ